MIEKRHYGQGFMTVGTFFALLNIYTKFAKTLTLLFSAILKLDQAVVASAALLCIPVVLSRLLYILYTSETWYHPALRPVYGLVRTWL